MGLLIDKINKFRDNPNSIPSHLKPPFKNKLILILSEVREYKNFVNYLISSDEYKLNVCDTTDLDNINSVDILLSYHFIRNPSLIKVIRFSKRYNIGYIVNFIRQTYKDKIEFDSIECYSISLMGDIKKRLDIEEVINLKDI